MLYLCMDGLSLDGLYLDGLSLDRYRSFERKLVNLPFPYAKKFRQALVFQKALSRLLPISSPLYIAFHMLQSYIRT